MLPALPLARFEQRPLRVETGVPDFQPVEAVRLRMDTASALKSNQSPSRLPSAASTVNLHHRRDRLEPPDHRQSQLT